MSVSLRDIQVLRSVLGRLNAELPAERPSLFDSETPRTVYQDREGEFRRRLLLAVESRPGKTRLLVTGQIGVGKSSELRDFYGKRLGALDHGIPVFCDLEKDESPERCGPTGLFLTILRDCWAATRNFTRGHLELNEIRNEILTRMVDWLSGVYTDDATRVVFSFSGTDSPIPLADRSRALGIILGKAGAP